MRLRPSSILAAAVLLALAACGDKSSLPVGAGVGPAPTLPEPKKSLIPTVDIAPAKGWNGGKPLAAQGLEVSAMATGLDHPRWLYVLPNGDVLVAESNKPQTPESKQSGIRAWVMGKVMAKAGAGVPSADRITLLRDSDGDGLAETRGIFLKNLHSPFGMALVGETLYVANADGIVRVPYKTGATEITETPQKVAPLPAGLNHHWTKNILASKDGGKLYATVGSNSNVGENGMEIEVNRAAILEVDVRTGGTRLFASGLRNPNGMAWEPQTGVLWTVANERDEIGSDLVPDYLTSVKEGGFYGWPYSYYGQHVDERVKPPRPDLVAKAISPDYALGAHVAALGLTFAEGAKLGPLFTNGAFIGQHGSWNRKPLSGYNVVYVPFANGKPNGKPVEVLSGFVDKNGDALGRPVGVAIDKAGALLVADDVGNAVWRVRPAAR
jgi:glucose/arabinose dehydrogenase